MTVSGTDTPAIPTPPPDGIGPPAGPDSPGAASYPNPGGRRPHKLRALLIGCVIATALAVFLFVGLGSSSSSGPSGPVVGVGSEAPGFSLPSLTGGTAVDLHALGKSTHHPVVLNFFASWCGPCQKETPLLARTAAAQQAQGSPVRFVGVDVNDPSPDALAFVQKSGIIYPVGVDRTFNVTSGKYALYGLPQTFFIDAHGRVVGRVQGAVTQAELDRWLHKLGGSSA